MSAFDDLVAADVNSVFIGNDEFDAEVTYTVLATGSSSTFNAIVEDLQDITARAVGGMDGEQLPGAAATARVHVSVTDVASPEHGDTITEADGTIWYVNQKSKQQGMHVLYCTSDQRMQY